MTIVVPEPSLVLLIGPSGSGKSTFAQAHFRPVEIVSSDDLRAMLANDPNDQGASVEAFRLLALLLAGRLRRRLLTVVDATNLRAGNRRRMLRLAASYGVPTVAVAFDLPDDVVRQRNARRPARQVEGEVVTEQIRRLREAVSALPAEGYQRLYVLRQPFDSNAVSVARVPAGA